jgi:Ser-tRNA(Ala) deacylase AlaX
LEIDYVKKVILSCQSQEQFNIAIDWSKRWKNSRKDLLIKIGFNEKLIENAFEMKHFHIFEYNIN